MRVSILRGASMIALLGLVGAARATGPGTPDLVTLKVAAEKGDPKAQYEYANRIHSTGPASQAMIEKSAAQGYGPAEAALAALLDAKAAAEAKDKVHLQRRAAVYASRAAYKNLFEGQALLSGYYERGVAVHTSAALAYGWMALAVKAADAAKSPRAADYKVELDRLVVATPTGAITAGQAFADAFQPGPLAPNPVETETLSAELALSSVFSINGHSVVLVNGTRFTEGDTMPLRIDGAMHDVTCVSIAKRSAKFKIDGADCQLVGK